METRKRQNRNVNGSIVSNPIFMMGNDVPHKAPANMVKKTALALLLNSTLGTFLNSSPVCSVLGSWL